MDAHRNLSDPHHLLHSHKDEFHRQEADTLVEEVQGTEENQVPLRTEGLGSGEGVAHQELSLFMTDVD